MPQPRISTQPVCLHVAQPAPLQMRHATSISALGSVNGKKLGRKRVFVSPKNLFAKFASVALRTTKEIPSSTAIPSNWANIGACDASKKSRRKTVPGAGILFGGGFVCCVCFCLGVVCVRCCL